MLFATHNTNNFNSQTILAQSIQNVNIILTFHVKNLRAKVIWKKYALKFKWLLSLFDSKCFHTFFNIFLQTISKFDWVVRWIFFFCRMKYIFTVLVPFVTNIEVSDLLMYCCLLRNDSFSPHEIWHRIITVNKTIASFLNQSFKRDSLEV